tara:strand:+ start:728 stop:1144 length:417 start_codon:yes stop_codon:yes gene_type:complete
MSEIITDKLTGKTTAKTVTVTVGATLTHSLETGLVKTFGGFNQVSTARFGVNTLTGVSQSLNVSSYDDISTGIYDANLTNQFTSIDKAMYGSCKNTNNISCFDEAVQLTNKVRMRATDCDSNAATDNYHYLQVLGGMA